MGGGASSPPNIARAVSEDLERAEALCIGEEVSAQEAHAVLVILRRSQLWLEELRLRSWTASREVIVTYRAARYRLNLGDIVGRVRLTVDLGDGSQPAELEPIGIHTASGFDLGYEGRGTVDLALTILCHHLKVPADPGWFQGALRRDHTGAAMAWTFHHALRRDYLTTSHECVSVTSEQIDRLLARRPEPPANRAEKDATRRA